MNYTRNKDFLYCTRIRENLQTLFPGNQGDGSPIRGTVL